MNSRKDPDIAIAQQLRDVDNHLSNLSIGSNRAELNELIKNLHSKIQSGIINDITQNVNFRIYLNLKTKGISWLIEQPHGKILSRDFAIEVLGYLDRGVMSLEEVGEIFQLRTVIDTASKIANSKVSVIDIDVANLDKSHFSQLKQPQLDNLAEVLISKIPSERLKIISFNLNLVHSDNLYNDEHNELYYICQPLQAINQNWVFIEDCHVKQIDILPLGVFNSYCEVKSADKAVYLTPEFGFSKAEDLVKNIALGKQGVMVSSPFQDTNDSVDGGVNGSIQLMIHDYYHGILRSAIEPEVRLELVRFYNACQEELLAVTKNPSRLEEDYNLKSELTNTISNFNPKDLLIAKKVLDTTLEKIIDMEFFEDLEDPKKLIIESINRVSNLLTQDKLLEDHLGDLIDSFPNFREIDVMLESFYEGHNSKYNPYLLARLIVDFKLKEMFSNN
jgi:hypothetical protein